MTEKDMRAEREIDSRRLRELHEIDSRRLRERLESDSRRLRERLESDSRRLREFRGEIVEPNEVKQEEERRLTVAERKKLVDLRMELIRLRIACLGQPPDWDGSIILSHAIRWLYFKIEDKPYEPITD